jgi:hypothetical protein
VWEDEGKLFYDNGNCWEVHIRNGKIESSRHWNPNGLKNYATKFILFIGAIFFDKLFVA